jgi:hypothetical protein
MCASYHLTGAAQLSLPSHTCIGSLLAPVLVHALHNCLACAGLLPLSPVWEDESRVARRTRYLAVVRVGSLLLLPLLPLSPHTSIHQITEAIQRIETKIKSWHHIMTGYSPDLNLDANMLGVRSARFIDPTCVVFDEAGQPSLTPRMLARLDEVQAAWGETPTKLAFPNYHPPARRDPDSVLSLPELCGCFARFDEELGRIEGAAQFALEMRFAAQGPETAVPAFGPREGSLARAALEKAEGIPGTFQEADGTEKKRRKELPRRQRWATAMMVDEFMEGIGRS